MSFLSQRIIKDNIQSEVTHEILIHTIVNRCYFSSFFTMNIRGGWKGGGSSPLNLPGHHVNHKYMKIFSKYYSQIFIGMKCNNEDSSNVMCNERYAVSFRMNPWNCRAHATRYTRWRWMVVFPNRDEESR